MNLVPAVSLLLLALIAARPAIAVDSDAIVVELEGPGVPQGCEFHATSIDMMPQGGYRFAGEFGSSCSTMVQPLTGPSTARVGVAFTLAWQARSPVTCTSGVGAGGSVFPGQVVSWPTSSIGTGTVICYDNACGNGAPVSRPVVATAVGLHTFRLVCYPLGSDISYVSTLIVNVTP